MAKNSVRIRLKAYEHRILDASAEKIVQAAQAHGAKKIVGPVPLPKEGGYNPACGTQIQRFSRAVRDQNAQTFN